MDDTEDGLLNIQLSDSEEDAQAAETAAESKKRRTGQTEEAFQAMKQAYRPKVENGNLSQHISFPLGPDATKQQNQSIIHATEELMYFRRYSEAVDFIEKSLNSEPGALDGETRKLLSTYNTKCQTKLASVK